MIWKEVLVILNKSTTTVLTAVDAGSKAAAGDPQVVGILLREELVQAQVPQTQISIGGARHEHLTARAEGTSHHCCVTHSSSPL